jgi:phage terminase small subunit
MFAGKLNDKERRFAEEYIIDLDRSRALQAAGYSAENYSSYAYELLQRPQIAEYIQYLKAEQLKRTTITADRVLNELARMAFLDPSKIVSIDEGGRVVLTPTGMLSEDDRRCISEISETKDGIRVKMTDKKGALELLGKHLKIFTDVSEQKHTFTQMPTVMIGDPTPDPETGKPKMTALTFEVGSDPNGTAG